MFYIETYIYNFGTKYILTTCSTIKRTIKELIEQILSEYGFGDVNCKPFRDFLRKIAIRWYNRHWQ